MGEHCLGEYCTLLKFAYFSCFYFVVYLSLTSCLRSLLLLCILVRGIRSPTRSSFVKSSISSFITWWPFFLKIPFHFHFSMIQFHFYKTFTFTSLLFPSGWRGSLSSSFVHIPSSKHFCAHASKCFVFGDKRIVKLFSVWGNLSDHLRPFQFISWYWMYTSDIMIFFYSELFVNSFSLFFLNYKSLSAGLA